jgi:hypothetical protein
MAGRLCELLFGVGLVTGGLSANHALPLKSMRAHEQVGIFFGVLMPKLAMSF